VDRNKGNRKSIKKQERFFTKRMQKKLLIIFCGIAAIMVGLSARLYYVSAEKGEQYSQKVLSQQKYDSTVIPYKRGDIKDRNGTVLATSEEVYNIILDVKILNKEEEEVKEAAEQKEAYYAELRAKGKEVEEEQIEQSVIEPTLEALNQCFGLDIEEVRTQINENPDSSYIVLKKQLTYDEVQEFSEWQETTNDSTRTEEEKAAETRPRLTKSGVWLEKEYLRKYPYGTLACDVIGFTVSGNVGNSGVEAKYNSELNGVNGREYGYLDSDSNLERTVKQAVNGNDLVLTLDANIQSIVDKHVKNFNDTIGSLNTCVIVMNPQNGEILAESTYPFYDLNNPRDLSVLYTEEEQSAMTEEQKLDALNGLWRNFAVSDTYEPGSTAKPLTVAMALEEGIVTPETTFYCDGFQEVAGSKIVCSKKTGHQLLTLEGSLTYSCNDAMMQLGAMMGGDIFAKYQSIFNFGQYTGIDLPGEAETGGLLHTAENMGPVDLATNAFGQNFNVTMTQIVAALASVVNGGYYYQPHVVKQIVNENGGIVENIGATLMKQTVSTETANTVKNYLLSVTETGTAQNAKIAGYDIGGKTGTAEKYPRGNEKFLVSFFGFTPMEEPEVLVYVIIDEPNVEKQSDSTLASNLCKDIMTEILPYLNIFPTNDDEIAAAQAAEDAQAADDAAQDAAPSVSDAQTAEDTTGEEPTSQALSPDELNQVDDIDSFFEDSGAEPSENNSE
jgi:stage V sporulation protein D (sporulation-specific penicillin-binding protein)